MIISIVTVVLNDKKGIATTIDSVVSQDFDDIEFIIIDGASTDGTIDEIKRNISHIDYFVSEPDKGLYDAMNKGKSFATGDYILFMNAGDEFCSSNAISICSQSFSDSTAKLYYGDVVIYNYGISGIAPKLHHQGVFYPKSFYKNNDYNTADFMIVGESDYTHRACLELDPIHVNVKIIKSKLEGFRITRFKSIQGTLRIFHEVLRYQKRAGTLSLIGVINYSVKCLIKYIAFKIGGLKLVTRLIIRKANQSV